MLVLGIATWCVTIAWSPYAECQQSDEDLAGRMKELEGEESATAMGPVVLARNKNLKLTLGGWITDFDSAVRSSVTEQQTIGG